MLAQNFVGPSECLLLRNRHGEPGDGINFGWEDSEATTNFLPCTVSMDGTLLKCGGVSHSYPACFAIARSDAVTSNGDSRLARDHTPRYLDNSVNHVP